MSRGEAMAEGVGGWREGVGGDWAAVVCHEKEPCWQDSVLSDRNWRGRETERERDRQRERERETKRQRDRKSVV